jgi:hypothetical protein
MRTVKRIALATAMLVGTGLLGSFVQTALAQEDARFCWGHCNSTGGGCKRSCGCDCPGPGCNSACH